MANSLGLDDDLDGVEVVELIEKAFDIDITDIEAESILNAGQMHDLLVQKISVSDPNNKCANPTAFEIEA